MSTARSPRRPLTETEAYALGLVASFGSCTAYRVRRAFATSPSAQGRGSAGSIYPVLRRLEDRDLIRSESRSQGKRKSRSLAITASGRQALKRWLAPPVADDLRLPLDPLRARVRFLGILDAADRARFLSSAASMLRGTIEELEDRARDYRKTGTAWEIAMANGAVQITRARLDWIEELSRA